MIKPARTKSACVFAISSATMLYALLFSVTGHAQTQTQATQTGTVMMIIKDREGKSSERQYIVIADDGQNFLLDSTYAMALKCRTGDRISFEAHSSLGQIRLENVQLID